MGALTQSEMMSTSVVQRIDAHVSVIEPFLCVIHALHDERGEFVAEIGVQTPPWHSLQRLANRLPLRVRRRGLCWVNRASSVVRKALRRPAPLGALARADGNTDKLTGLFQPPVDERARCIATGSPRSTAARAVARPVRSHVSVNLRSIRSTTTC